MTPSKFVYKLKNAIRTHGFLLQATSAQPFTFGVSKKTQRSLSFLFVLTLALFQAGCQTAPKNTDENLRYFKGKAQVIDKHKNKEDWVYFSSTAVYPRQLRMDMSMGLLGIGVGSLAINDNKAVMVSPMERKAYTTEDGTKLLTKLMKTEVSPRDVIAIFAEKFPIAGWQCTGDPKAAEKTQCNKGEVSMEWEPIAEDNRRLILESPRSKVTFVYKSVDSGNKDFNLKVPSTYKTISL